MSFRLREVLADVKAAYIICSNYRSGSTLLALSLSQMAVAGRPNEYFAPTLVQQFANRWGVDPGNFAEYLSRVIECSTTENGVFGTKIMFPDLGYFLSRLSELKPNHSGPEIDLLRHYFPNIRFIYVYRRHKLRQAISMVKSSQTRIWHVGIDEESVPHRSEQQPLYDERRITHDLVFGVIRCELEWERFFQRNNISPEIVVYEDFVDQFHETLSRIARYLDIPTDALHLVDRPPLRRLADETTEEWLEEYIRSKSWDKEAWPLERLVRNDFAPALVQIIKEEWQRCQEPKEAEEIQIDSWQPSKVNSDPSLVTQTNDPVWIRDHISWRNILKALALKCAKRIASGD